MDRSTLEGHYRAYIDVINSRGASLSASDLSLFAHPSVKYNGSSMTLSEYCNGPTAAFNALNGLFFRIDTLVVDAASQQVACRLSFDDVRPKQGRGTEMLGLTAGKDRLSFSENVIYTFKEGKIAEVWSLIDNKAFEAE